MNRRHLHFQQLSVVLGAAILLSSAAYAQEPKTGKLKVRVSREEAYTFVDDKAMGPHGGSIRLSEGKHTVPSGELRFKTLQQDVTITPGQTTTVVADLQPDGANVSGPWGRIQIEVGTLTRGDYAVLLKRQNGRLLCGACRRVQ